MSFDPTKHDMGLLMQDDTTKIGLMLVRDKNGRPLYEIVDDEYLIQQQAAVPGYDNLQAEKEIRVGATSHRSGFGLDVYDATDPERYLSSTNFDLRFKDMAFCGPKATGIANPNNTAVCKCMADFAGRRYFGIGKKLYKLDAEGDGFTAVKEDFVGDITALEPFADGLLYIGQEGDTVIENCEDAWAGETNITASLDTTDYKVGSGSAKFVATGDATAGAYVYEGISETDFSSHTGVKFWFKCSIATDAADFQFRLQDGVVVKETLNIPALVAGVWTRVYLKLSDPSACDTIDRVAVEYNVDIGACDFWIDDVETEEGYWYMNSAETFTQSTASNALPDPFAHFFKTVDAGTPTLWKGLKPNSLYSNTNPVNGGANWSTATTVSTAYYDILSLFTNGTSLYIKKEDRTFYLDSNGAVQVLIEETKHLAEDTTGDSAIVWQGKAYVPCGAQSLVEYNAGTITWRSPAKFCTNLSAFNGRVQVVAADEEYLFAMLDNGSYVEVLAGRLETIDSTTKFVWHPICQITLGGCQAAGVSSVYERRLWITSTTAANSIYSIQLPDGYGDPVNDSNCLFQTGGYFITPWLHGQFKGDNKVWIKLTLTMEDVDTDVYFKAYYQLKSDAAWSSSIGNFQTEPSTTHYITTATSDVISNKTDIYIRFKIEAITNSTSSTPVLKGYDCRAILKPTKRNVISATVKCDDEVVDKEGNALDDSADTIATALREAKNTAGLVTIWDINGDALYVNVLAHPNFEQIIETEKDRVVKRVFNLILQEVALS